MKHRNLVKKYGRRLGVVLGLTSVMPAYAVVDYSGLVVDFTGVDVAAIGIGTSILAVLAVFWGIRRILGLVS